MEMEGWSWRALPPPFFFINLSVKSRKKIARGFEVGQKQEKLVISLLKLLEKRKMTLIKSCKLLAVLHKGSLKFPFHMAIQTAFL